jgi:hypothetical protein
MSVTASSWAAKMLTKAFGGERLLGLAGGAMACASGCFALYMTMHGPSASFSNGDHYFTVFAQLGGHGRPAPAAVGLPPDVDTMATGSIRQKKVLSDGRPVLQNMQLRQVDGDSALIEINDNLAVFKIGDVIPGGGRLLAMTQEDGRPALETSKGLILQAQAN